MGQFMTVSARSGHRAINHRLQHLLYYTEVRLRHLENYILPLMDCIWRGHVIVIYQLHSESICSRYHHIYVNLIIIALDFIRFLAMLEILYLAPKMWNSWHLILHLA